MSGKHTLLEAAANTWIEMGCETELLTTAKATLSLIREIAALEAERDALRADAARYRWLAERFTGYDFNWMPSEEGKNDGYAVIVFGVPDGFRGSRDIGASIDAAIAEDGAQS